MVRFYHNKNIMSDWTSNLTLITDPVSCYLWEDIEKHAPEDDLKRLSKWHAGQTGPLIGNKSGIYSWDLERWIDQGKQTEQGPDWD